MHLQVGLFLWCTKEIKAKLTITIDILLWPNQVTICGSLTDYKFRSIFPNMHSPDRFQSAPAYHWPLIYSEFPPTRKSQFKESFCRRQIYPLRQQNSFRMYTFGCNLSKYWHSHSQTDFRPQPQHNVKVVRQ